MPNEEKALPGTCAYFWWKLRPFFTVATQPVEKLSQERVEYYRKTPGARAIAYFIDGYMTALLDGHHKAMAAALEGRKVNSLVIVPCYSYQWREKDGQMKAYVGIENLKFSCEKYEVTVGERTPYQRPSQEQQRAFVQAVEKQMPQAPLQERLPYETDVLAKQYPNVIEAVYMEIVGELTEEWIDGIVTGQIVLEPEEIDKFLIAMSGSKHPRLWEVADYFLYHYSHDKYIVETCFRELVKLPHTEELDAYLIEQMVNHEDEHENVTYIVMNSF